MVNYAQYNMSERIITTHNSPMTVQLTLSNALVNEQAWRSAKRKTGTIATGEMVKEEKLAKCTYPLA